MHAPSPALRFARWRRALILALLACCSCAAAQPQYPPPAGVYCSCGPTTGRGYGSVDPAIAAKPFVNGILVRVAWELLEPAAGQYAWQLIDGQLAAARAAGKRISLGIGSGIAIPQWVFAMGAARLESLAPRHDTIAVPWDTVYLGHWESLVRALGERYRGDSTIAMVYMTHSTGNGFEMQLPFVTSPSLAAIGYSDAKMIASWKRVVDAFAAAFPGHVLSNDFHPVNGSDAVADSVYAYARAVLGTRYGAGAWWWTQRNTTVYPAQYGILRSSASAGGFAGVQMAHSGTSNPDLFGAGGMPAALRLAIRDGICYWEVWNEDILNPAFDSLLSHASCSTTEAAMPDPVPGAPLLVYPNPCTQALNVACADGIVRSVAVYDALGRRVYSGNTGTRTIDVSHWPPGVYLLHLAAPDGTWQSRTFLRARW